MLKRISIIALVAALAVIQSIFLREYENLSFNEAVEELAKIAGVDVPKDEKKQQAYSVQKVLLEALDYAGLRYRSALESH